MASYEMNEVMYVSELWCCPNPRSTSYRRRLTLCTVVFLPLTLLTSPSSFFHFFAFSCFLFFMFLCFFFFLLFFYFFYFVVCPHLFLLIIYSYFLQPTTICIPAHL